MKKKTLFWVSALLQVLYLYGILSQLLFVLYAVSLSFSLPEPVWRLLISGSVQVAIFYLYFLYLFPKVLFKNKIKTFIACTVVIGLLNTCIRFVYDFNLPIHWSLDQQTLSIWLGFLFQCFIIGTMRGVLSWLQERQHRAALEKQNLETNLALLKAQINPHFLFNTLNNIDVLIEKDQTTASTYLKKLSDILRFTLYETPSETIPLSREVEYIDQYIDLQKIRTNNPDFVNFEVKIDNKFLEVAPMLFIPFIENAFKHSTNKKISNAIHIVISTGVNSVRFNCSNAYDAEAIKTQEQSGLGLELIKSRLELLYPHNYKLDVNKTSDRFNVDLSVTLIP